jgi:hypothetical protein
MLLQENLGGGSGRGCSLGGHFYGGARANGKETPVRGRRSGRGGQRSGRGVAPWRRGARYGVNKVGEQSEKAAAGEVLTKEDGGEGNLVARLR